MQDGGEISTEDILAAQMAAKASSEGVSFVAFTATPKAKTMELFGRRSYPDQPAGPANLPAPFHVYSMRQAIEEGFILDVLKNYTPYKLAFRLANESKELDESAVERGAAQKALMQWVKLHPYNISQKVQIVVEHYRSTVMPLLEGRAKAMVVLGSRKEAVRWQIAIRRYIAAKGYQIGTLVAFSGEVDDPESGPDPFTEKSKALNPTLKGDIRGAFKLPDQHILLVANKFQTGFDEPLLCGMYIDRRLAGIQAVQTLSRLNRAYQHGSIVKDTTYVLDFANGGEDILAAFKTYFDTAELADVTDPNQVYDLRAKLDALGFYDDFEVERVVRAELDPKATHGSLAAAISPVAERLLKRYKQAQADLAAALAVDDAAAEKAAKDTMDALLLFKGDMGAFLRLYSFLSQIFDFGTTGIEARSIFYRRLIPLLEFGRERDDVDLSKVKLTHHRLIDQGKTSLAMTSGGEKLHPITESGSGKVQDKEKALLAEIVERLNDLFQGAVTDADQLVYVNNVIKGKLLENAVLVQQAMGNGKGQFANSPTLDSALTTAIIDAMDAHGVMSKQALESEAVRKGILEALLGPGRLYEALRSRAA